MPILSISEDFFSITGFDTFRVIHQVVFATSGDHDGNPPEHSLLVSGNFNQARIFRSASADSLPSQYRGITGILVPPLERERGVFKEKRLLAIIDSHIAIFGTVASVEQEIDRHLAGIGPDSSILQRLHRLRDDDDTWCLISARGFNAETRQILERLDSALAKLVEKSRSFQFGIDYGRRVDFEYEINAPSRPALKISRIHQHRHWSDRAPQDRRCLRVSALPYWAIPSYAAR